MDPSRNCAWNLHTASIMATASHNDSRSKFHIYKMEGLIFILRLAAAAWWPIRHTAQKTAAQESLLPQQAVYTAATAPQHHHTSPLWDPSSQQSVVSHFCLRCLYNIIAYFVSSLLLVVPHTNKTIHWTRLVILFPWFGADSFIGQDHSSQNC